MSLKPAFGLQQTQSLVMTPQLLQSIKLLQFNTIELEQFIAAEIESNPLLKREESEVAFGENVTRQDPQLPNTHSTRSESGARETLSPVNSRTPTTKDDWDTEAYLATPQTLHSDLQEQIALIFKDPIERALGLQLAESLEESGYLTDFDDILAHTPSPQLEHILLTLQHNIEPPGLFARNLAECLSLQLRAKERLDPAMQTLLQHLDLLARRDFASLKKLCGVDETDLIDMLAEIRMLDPKPGTIFSTGTPDVIVPEVIICSAPDGSWVVELNEDVLPRVLIDQAYFTTVSAHAAKSDQSFFAECLQKANWLVRTLDQRSKSILKVAAEIVRHQDAFFVHGVNHLRPLKLKTIADLIGLHESTVSRITANKFMLTPRGTFEMRYFFTAAIAAADGGDAHSAEAVRNRIRHLIDSEQADDILSDDALVDALKKDGIEVARRTVAKYRDSMDIPSSVQRRREKHARSATARAPAS